MCFTINVHTTRNAIENRFKADTGSLSDFEFRYFYRAFDFPALPVITQAERQKVDLLHWGLVPAWSRDREHAEMIRRGTCNARAETLAEKPSFKKSLHNRRCWVLSLGFYEWQHLHKEKIPWYIYRPGQPLFAFAGLYDEWQEKESGSIFRSFTIITTQANSLMETVHNSKKRMPVILDEKMEEKWLDKDASFEEINAMLDPYPEEMIRAHTISKKISGPMADAFDPTLIDRLNYPVSDKLL